MIKRLSSCRIGIEVIIQLTFLRLWLPSLGFYNDPLLASRASADRTYISLSFCEWSSSSDMNQLFTSRLEGRWSPVRLGWRQIVPCSYYCALTRERGGSKDKARRDTRRRSKCCQISRWVRDRDRGQRHADEPLSILFASAVARLAYQHRGR